MAKSLTTAATLKRFYKKEVEKLPMAGPGTSTIGELRTWLGTVAPQVLLGIAPVGPLSISRAKTGKQFGKEVVKFNQSIKRLEKLAVIPDHAPIPTSLTRLMGSVIKDAPPRTFTGIESLTFDIGLGGSGAVISPGIRVGEQLPRKGEKGKLKLHPSYLNPKTLLHEATHGGQFSPRSFEEGELTPEQVDISRRARVFSDLGYGLMEQAREMKDAGFPAPSDDDIWKLIPTERHAERVAKYILGHREKRLGKPLPKGQLEGFFWETLRQELDMKNTADLILLERTMDEIVRKGFEEGIPSSEQDKPKLVKPISKIDMNKFYKEMYYG